MGIRRQSKRAVRVGMAIDSELKDLLDHADFPPEIRGSLRLSLDVLLTAYEEDDDPQKIQPDSKSFHYLLTFLSHPYHRLWVSPAIAVSPEGVFVAVWEQPGTHRWILNFLPTGEIREIYLNTDHDGRIHHQLRNSRIGDYIYPFFSVANR
jgi:hypothetical protein